MSTGCQRCTRFQSLPGFLPCCDTKALPRAGGRRSSFNPFRVFYPAATASSKYACPNFFPTFQSLPGFLPCCDEFARISSHSRTCVSIPSGFSTLLRHFVNVFNRIVMLFQSLPGFLPCCDSRIRPSRSTNRTVSIPSGFSTLLRLRRSLCPVPRRFVSIPSGFSTLLRLGMWSLWWENGNSFNPFRVFYPAATSYRPPPRHVVRRFNPFRVFYPAAT